MADVMNTSGKLDPKKKALILRELRSPKNKQIRNRLFDGDERCFCAVGVVCEVFRKVQRKPKKWYWDKYTQSFSGWSLYCPNAVTKWLGIGGRNGPEVTIGGVKASISFHNDNGCTFAQIADAIDAQL